MIRTLSFATGLALMLTPLAGRAQPISEHYVKNVLERADNGLTGTSGGGGFSSGKYEWLNIVAVAVLSLVDTERTVITQERDLFEITPCLHVDLLMIREKAELARQKLNEAFEAEDPEAIVKTQAVIRFLENSYEELLRGGRDPLYEDESWGLYQIFDTEQTWCCAESNDMVCTQTSEEECLDQGGWPYSTASGCSENSDCTGPSGDDQTDTMCPFHSDYLPASREFGCDRIALGKIMSNKPAALEYAALDKLAKEREAFLNEDAPELKDAAEAVARFLAKPVRTTVPLLPPASPPAAKKSAAADKTATLQPEEEPEHRVIFGCQQPDELSEPLEEFFDRAIGWEMRGPFSLSRNYLRLVPAIWRMRTIRGGNRDFAEYLEIASESDTADGTQDDDPAGPLEWVLRWFGRTTSREWNQAQSGEKNRMDAQRESIGSTVATAMGPLRQSMFQLGTAQKNLRGFVREMAMYLRKSCVMNPCAPQLEKVIKVTFEDACFPYALSIGGAGGEIPDWKDCVCAIRKKDPDFMKGPGGKESDGIEC